MEWAFRKAKFSNGSEMVWSLYKVLSPRQLESTVEMGRAAGFKKNKLSDWASRIGFNLNHHDDRSDTYCAYEVYKHLKARNGNQDFIQTECEKLGLLNNDIPF